MKIDPTVKKETGYVAAGEGILLCLMYAVFLILSKMSLGVLLGGLIGGALAAGNFLLMGISLQKALERENDSKQLMKASLGFRNLGIVAVLLIAVCLLHCNVFACVIPLLFPRITITVRGFAANRKNKQ